MLGMGTWLTGECVLFTTSPQKVTEITDNGNKTKTWIVAFNDKLQNVNILIIIKYVKIITDFPLQIKSYILPDRC